MRRFLVLLVLMLGLVAAGPGTAAAAFTLSGTATIEGDTVKLVSDFSDTAATNDFGAVSFTVPAGTTFGSLTNLSAVYSVTDDDCGGGSPRFQVNVGGKNVFVYLGPSPTFTGCTANTFTNSGNLVGTSDACRVDTSQFTGGKQCSTWAEAVTLLGSQAVTGIQFAVDGGWKMADKEQTVLLRSVTINGTTQTFGPQGGGGNAGKVSPGQVCNALRSRMGRAAFNELWSTSGTSNGMGKCASTMAKARNAGLTHAQIMEALAACTAQGKKGAALGACVAARDGTTATLTEAQEKAAKAKAKSKANRGKGKSK
jgi:hypothetical protein